MNDPVGYLAEIELVLLASPIVAEYAVVRSWADTDDGYLRVRVRLTNGDFLEATEYFVLQGDQTITMDYRHQWMDESRETLHRRWDNTRDHPELVGFPHHVHIADEKNVAPGQPLSISEVLKVIEVAIAEQ